MWLSKKLSVHRRVEQEGAAADMGVTTIGGANAAVMTRGEQRDLEVFSPAGLVWQPKSGDTVLVIKGGVGGQEQCVIAAETRGQAPKNMVPGELYLYSDAGTFIYLCADGSIQVKGDVTLTGDLAVEGNVTLRGQVDIYGALTVNGEPYRPCTC